MAEMLDLSAKQHGSRVLGAWIASQDGAAERAGLVALGENSFTDGMSITELANMLGAGHRTSAGISVTKENAMRVTAVYSCVSLLAGAISTMPLGIFERSGGDRQKAVHDYWWMLNERACEGWTSAAAWEYIISSKLFHGDGFARLLRPNLFSSKVIGIEPLHPLSVDPFRKDGRVSYRVNPSTGDAPYTLDAADILHFPSLGFDGLRSPSPITYAAREAIGTAIAAQDLSGKFFAGGGTFDYALKAPGKLGTPQLDALKASLIARAQNGGRGPLILSGGLEPAHLTFSSKDAEILATRLFTVEEICRALGVPPHMVGHTDKSTSFGTGIEQQGISFVRYTLQRHLTPMVQEINHKLWPVRQKYFVEHITAALERGDLKSRTESYRVALGRAGEQPWMSVDEVRRLENMAPHPGLKPNMAAKPTEPVAD